MHIEPVINSIQASLLEHGRFAADDETLAEAIGHVADALGPAVRLAAMDIAEQAAAEVRAQLPGYAVDVVVRDGDPTLQVSETPATDDGRDEEEFDARISLRLPPTLKASIEDAAGAVGASVNTWVIDAVGQHARRHRRPGRRFDQAFDL